MEVEKKYKLLFRIFVIVFLINILLIGTIFNFYAIMNNNCLMPVKVLYEKIYDDGKHFEYQNFSQVKVSYLTDFIYVDSKWFSIGDFFIYGSVIFLAILFIFWGYKDFLKNRKI